MVNSSASTVDVTTIQILGPTSAVEEPLIHPRPVATANPPVTFNATANHTLNTNALHEFHPPHKHYSRGMISVRVETEEVRRSATGNTRTMRKILSRCPLGGIREVQDVDKWLESRQGMGGV